MESKLEEPSYLDNVQYDLSSNATRLHTLDICFGPGYSQETRKLWIIYIHGGAWRDPDIDSKSFSPARQLLISENRISALASLNYRLSPYPTDSRHSGSSDDPARNARHPDHLKDICCALDFLQKQYHFGSHYLLVGHSCGATLAFQSLLEHQTTFQKPSAVLGVEGIYDLLAFRNHFKDNPIYQEFLTGAFGEDEEVWKKASPVHGNLSEIWKEGKLAYVAHSKEDSMVEESQAVSMVTVLKKSVSNGKREVELLWIKGQHDDIWRKGDALARSIQGVLDALETINS